MNIERPKPTCYPFGIRVFDNRGNFIKEILEMDGGTYFNGSVSVADAIACAKEKQGYVVERVGLDELKTDVTAESL